MGSHLPWPIALPRQYNEFKRKYNLGYAFFEPASSLDVKPGASGYIDTAEFGTFLSIYWTETQSAASA